MASHKRLWPRSAAEYLDMLRHLLPRGLAWTRALGAKLTAVLRGTAEEAGRVDVSAHLLMDEVNPLYTHGGLEDWERVLALPDTCLPAGNTFQERHDAVLAKLNDSGRQDLAWWREQAALLGYEIDLEEHWPFMCGWHECGDPTGCAVEAVQASNIGFIGPEEIRYWLNVIVRGDRLILFRCGESECGERLMDWRSAASLECIMRRDMEAHILLTFEYLEA